MLYLKLLFFLSLLLYSARGLGNRLQEICGAVGNMAGVKDGRSRFRASSPKRVRVQV